MQDEPQKPGEDAREEPTNEAQEEGETLKERRNVVNVIQQNAVIITSWKGGRKGETNSKRWV